MLCPRCQYDLTGLPEVHTCPECGFAYDQRERVFIIGQRKWVRLIAALNLPFYLSFFFIAAYRMNRSFPAWGLMLYLVVIAGFAWQIYRGSPKGSAMLVGPDGIRFDPPWRRITSLSWDQISGAECSIWNGSLIFLDHNMDLIVRCPISRHRDMKVFKRLAKEIDEMAKRVVPSGLAS